MTPKDISTLSTFLSDCAAFGLHSAAQRHGISHIEARNILYTLRRIGLKIPYIGQPSARKINLPQAEALRSSGATYAEIAEHFSMSVGGTWLALNKGKRRA